VAVPSSVSISGSKSVSCWLSWADELIVKDPAQGCDVGEYKYLASKLLIRELWAPEMLPVGAGGNQGRDGVSSGVDFLCQLERGAPVPLLLQHLCRLFVVPFWQGRHLAGWFWRSIARCLSIAAFTYLYPGNTLPHLFSSRTTGRGWLIRHYVLSLAERKNPPLAIFTVFIARRMSDCSSCTQPPGFAIVVDMFNFYKKLFAASNNEIQLVPQTYKLP